MSYLTKLVVNFLHTTWNILFYCLLKTEINVKKKQRVTARNLNQSFLIFDKSLLSDLIYSFRRKFALTLTYYLNRLNTCS